MSNLHIDPITVKSHAVIDAICHPLETIKIVQKKWKLL